MQIGCKRFHRIRLENFERMIEGLENQGHSTFITLQRLGLVTWIQTALVSCGTLPIR